MLGRAEPGTAEKRFHALTIVYSVSSSVPVFDFCDRRLLVVLDDLLPVDFFGAARSAFLGAVFGSGLASLVSAFVSAVTSGTSPFASAVPRLYISRNAIVLSLGKYF